MKKVNKNLFTFIIVFLFIGAGFLSRDYIGTMINSVKGIIYDTKEKGITEAFSRFTDSVENNSTEYLSYHNKCMDLNSAYNNLINTHVVSKDDQTVVKMNNDYLAEEVEFIPDKTIHKYAENVKALQDKTNIPVVYVLAPQKGYNGGTPDNTDNYIESNCDRFISQLQQNKLDFLDLREAMNAQKTDEREAFFNTDHHWKPQTGLWACNEICQKLKTDYDFTYNKDYLDISNYNVKTYENFFLGSYGKKTGTYFTWYGLDDFDLITPKFDTSFSVENRIKNTKKSGSFESSLLALDKLNFSDVYNSWTYSVYGNGDNALQEITNNNADKGEKNIMIVRDSFAGVVTPFMALQCKNIYEIDLRKSVVGTDIVESVSEYANQIKPDLIIILYKTVKTEECYEFN